MTAIARNSDPISSHAAAAAITQSGTRAIQKDATLKAVRQWPGCTSYELAEKVGGGLASRYMLARRLPELAKDRLVDRLGLRHCRITGHLATTWYPVPQQMGFSA